MKLLHHFGGGRPHTGTRVLLLRHDLQVRVINAATGELLRELTLDPDRDYQPTGPTHTPAPQAKTPDPDVGSGPFLSHDRSQCRDGGIRTRGLLLPKQAR